MEGDAERFGNVVRVNTFGIWVVVKLVCFRVPELNIVPKTGLLVF